MTGEGVEPGLKIRFPCPSSHSCFVIPLWGSSRPASLMLACPSESNLCSALGGSDTRVWGPSGLWSSLLFAEQEGDQWTPVPASCPPLGQSWGAVSDFPDSRRQVGPQCPQRQLAVSPPLLPCFVLHPSLAPPGTNWKSTTVPKDWSPGLLVGNANGDNGFEGKTRPSVSRA